MAASVATFTVISFNQVWKEDKMMKILGTITIGASPLTYVTGGITCALQGDLIKAQLAPQYMIVLSQNGYTYAFVPGTNNTNGTLKIFTALGTELGNGSTIPAGNSGDVIQAIAVFLGQN